MYYSRFIPIVYPKALINYMGQFFNPVPGVKGIISLLLVLLSKRIFFPRVYVFLVIPVFYGSSLSAQKNNSIVTNQVWVDFNPRYKISDRFTLAGKVGAKAIYPKAWYKFYTSAEVAYSIPKFMLRKLKYKEKVYLGVDFYYVFFTELPDVIEISPYQGYTLTWPNRKRLDIRHNVELGERFQWDVQDWNYSFGLKVSYEASLTFKFQGDLWSYGKGFYLSASAKFWWNLISTTVFNDVVRITPGIGYEINPKWKTAFYIGYNYTRNLTIDNFHANNIIYRFRVYYTIN